jgi:hypothetical protein
LTLVLTAPRAHGFSTSDGERELASIEARWTALSQAPRRDAKALAELDRRASMLAADASRGLAALREEAAEHDADMAAVVAGRDWQTIEALLLKLKFRIAAIDLERALAGDAEHDRLAHAAVDGFAAFVDAPDPSLAAEARYGRGLARIAAGDRSGGIADLRAAAAERTVAARARLALADALAEAGDRGEALDVVSKQIAAGGMPRDLALRAKLLRLKLIVGMGGKQAAMAPDLGAHVAELLAAGEPWRGAALALLRGHEDLLPSGDAADPTVLLLRADAAARRNDAAAALELYRQAVARGGAAPDPAALDGLARSALGAGAWQEARSAVAGLRKTDRPFTRELALIDLRAAYGLWQAAPDAASAAALIAAADAVASVKDATADERAEAAFRRGEALRAAGDLDESIAAFAAIEAPAWQTAASVAALQGRVLRHVREPGEEPRDALLRDLGVALARGELPADARATVVLLDATVRTTPVATHPPATPPPALDPAGQRAALQRLRDFARTFPDSKALLPAVLRSRALLELDTASTPDPAMLAVLDEQLRPTVAAAVAGDLRDEVTSVSDVVTSMPAGAARDAARERGRRALAGALAFAALAAPEDRSAGRLELAQSASVLGDSATAVLLFRAEADAKPTSLRALRGLALAAEAGGDATLARTAWDRLAAIPDLPPAVREEADRARGAAAAAPQPSPARR